MGANCASCFGGQKSTRQIKASPQKEVSVINSLPGSSQKLPESILETPKKKQESYPSTAISGSVITNIENSLQRVNPEDILISPFDKTDSVDPQQQQDIWSEAASAQSSIVRFSSKIKKSLSDQSHPKQSKMMLEDLKACQMFEGELTTERFEEKITISNEQLNIEFMLSRCRAGPMVVPFIDYDNYANQQ